MNTQPKLSIVSLYIRSSLFWVTTTIATLTVGSIIVIAFPLPADIRLKIAELWSASNMWALKVFCNLNYVVEGKENIGEQNAIVLCKHQSTWETLSLHLIVPLGRWVFKRELLIIPFFGWALAATDPISLNRGSGRAAVKQLIKKGTEKLKKGKWIIMFPEGTRTAVGSKTKYKSGGAILAAESGYPVLPIAHNAGQYWPKHSFIKWPGTIRVVIGPLITSEGKKPDEILRETQSWIENKMQEICDPVISHG